MHPIQRTVFNSRFLLVPVYFGLIIAEIGYSVKFFQEIYHMACEFKGLGETELLIGVLTLLDIAMIANLIMMIIIGSYSTFVSELQLNKTEAKPAWLNHISAGTLKVKMGSSIIGVSSIHLLKDFIGAENINWDTCWKRMAIHIAIVISTVALQWFTLGEKIDHKVEQHEEIPTHH